MGSIIYGWPMHLRLCCLTEYRSAFPSGMTVLSQMPPFLRFDLRLFSEDKVMQNESIHHYCPHLAVCKGHYPWRQLSKNQWNCLGIRCIRHKFQCQSLNWSSFLGGWGLRSIVYPLSQIKQSDRCWKCGFFGKFPFGVLNFCFLPHILCKKLQNTQKISRKPNF